MSFKENVYRRTDVCLTKSDHNSSPIVFDSGELKTSLKSLTGKPVVLEPCLSVSEFIILVYLLLITSTAYIQVHFRQLFIIEANIMNPDQTAPCLQSILYCYIYMIRKKAAS